MRIPHLEDVLFIDPTAPRKILSELVTYGWANLKWDGSPAFHMVHKRGEGLLINLTHKIPVHWSTFGHTGYERILRLIGETLEPYVPADSATVVCGDFLFSELSEDREFGGANMSFQPNTIRYVFRKAPKDIKLGIALHTVNGYPGQFYVEAPSVWVAPTVVFIRRDFPCNLFEHCPFDIPRAEAESFKRYVNQKVRNGLSLLSPVEFKTSLDPRTVERMVAAYVEVIDVKTKILEEINEMLPHEFPRAYNDNVPMKHEGIVFHSARTGMTVKLVDRLEFSHLNFNRKRVYGR